MPLARINGIKFNYKVEGRGRPLVMISGIGLPLGSLNRQAAVLKKHFTVVRLDNRGAGKTDKPAGPYSTPTMAEDVIGLMDLLKIGKADVFGYSMGGMIAQEVALGHPDRLEKLVLCATYSCIDKESGPTPEVGKLAGLSGADYLRAFLKLVSGSAARRFFWFWKMALTSSAESRAGFRAQLAACQTHNTVQRLGSIRASTLVVVGTNDRLIRPQSSEVLAREIPHARLTRIPNGSHLIPIERANDLSAVVLQFLLPPS